LAESLLHSSSAPTSRQALALLRGSRLFALMEVFSALLSGLTEAAILTLFARVGLSTLGVENSGVNLPGFGSLSTLFALQIVLVLTTTRVVLGVASAWMVGRISFRIVTGIRLELAQLYSKTSYTSKKGLEDGSFQQLIVSFPSLGNGLIQGLLQSFGAAISMVAMLTFSVVTEPMVTFAGIAAVSILATLLLPLRRRIQRLAERAVSSQVRLSTTVAELGSLVDEFEAFNAQPFGFESVSQRVLEDSEIGRRSTILKNLVTPLYLGSTYLVLTLSLVTIYFADASRLVTFGPVLLVLLRALQYGQGVQNGLALLSQIGPFLRYLNSTGENLLEQRPPIGDRSLTSFREIRFVNTSFTYKSESRQNGVAAVNFTIQEGENVGLIGPSGSGKSTVLRLLLGFFRPDEGAILVDGEHLQNLDLIAWRSLVGYVPQSPKILSATVAENVRFFRLGIPDKDVERALRIAGLQDEISALPDGNRTKIGMNTDALSGGQLQRLSIARALAGRPELILMDEPTSSIDEKSEDEVTAAIAAASLHSSILVATHRPRILAYCDRVVDLSSSVGPAIEQDSSRIGINAPSKYGEH